VREGARNALSAAARWRLPEFVFWLLVLAAPFVFPSRLLLISDIAIFAIFALSLDLILGYAGIVSLGHVAFFGCGAYVAGLLAAAGYREPLSILAIAGAAAGLLGLVTSPLILRGSDLTRLMVTLAVASILYELVNQAGAVTGGANGLNVSFDPIFGVFRFDLFGRTAAAYSLAVLIVLLLLARLIVNSPFGLSLRAIRVNRLRAAAIGVPTGARLVAIYAIAAAYAGVAGALLAETTQFLSLDLIDFHRSADVLLALVLGGGGWLYGAMIGAAVLRVMRDLLSGLTPQYWEFWVGFVLVAVVLIGRERLAAIWRWPASLMTGKRR
jgi:branched-chain amino acid transport system permease protein